MSQEVHRVETKDLREVVMKTTAVSKAKSLQPCQHDQEKGLELTDAEIINRD